jgi:hypothetical protein
MTTEGWKHCIQWKDGSTSWEPLSSVKESNPVEVAEYAVAQKLETEPAFSLWLPYSLKKRERIVDAVNKRYVLRSHKFGVKLPKSVQDALRINEQTNTTYWRNVIALEIKNVDVDFKDLEVNEEVPVGYQFCQVSPDL